MNTGIIEKIKKLLRLARSSNPHEAALAMQRALALAEEHRIVIEGINPDRPAPAFAHQSGKIFGRLPHEHQFAALIVQRFFRVKSINQACVRVTQDGWPRDGQKMTFVGTASDLEIALYVFDFLTFHFAWCWRKHRGRCRNRYSFLYGMYVGLHSKLAETEPPAPERQARGTELELSMKNYLAEHFPNLKTHRMPNASAQAAQWAGYAQGRKTEIRPGIKHTETTPLALT